MFQKKMLNIQIQITKEFVERTGCDSLAIAIGTSHGAYKFKGEARLRMDILKQVKEKYQTHQ